MYLELHLQILIKVLLLQNMQNQKDVKNVTVLTNTGSDYSVGLANAFKEQAKKEGIQVKEEQYTADDKDFRALLTKVKGYNPEVIFVPDYYNTIGLILTQAKELGINAQFMGGDEWTESRLTLEKLLMEQFLQVSLHQTILIKMYKNSLLHTKMNIK